MYLMSTHRGFIGVHQGQLIQLPDIDDPRVTRLDDDLPQEVEITVGPLTGFVISSTHQGVSLSRAGQFACATDSKILIDATSCSYRRIGIRRPNASRTLRWFTQWSNVSVLR